MQFLQTSSRAGYYCEDNTSAFFMRNRSVLFILFRINNVIKNKEITHLFISHLALTFY
ncbi:hypothetical protein WP8S18E06_05020 [Klebsiella sp. WP8-S18-ESBL-06]|nr:hypothetical protein WP8S18E06_05020 [Klebsiella sp. WP8-S18-ESBL-06]